MRHYSPGQPIRVQSGAQGQPLVFVWRGETYRVETIEDVREPRLDWWSPTGEIHRVYYLVTTHRSLICEIYRDVPTAQWFLGRVYD